MTKKGKRNNLPGKRFGPPPKRGPNSQGLTLYKKLSYNT